MDIHTPLNVARRPSFDYGKLAPPHPSMPNAGGEPMWTSPAPKRSKRWILWAAITVLILGLAGGGYVAYSKGFLVLPFLSPKTEELFAKMVDSMGGITNAQYSFRFMVKTEAKENGATPLILNSNSTSPSSLDSASVGPLLGLSSGSPYDFFSSIPTDMSLDGGLTFYYDDTDDPKKANAFVRLDGTYTGGDLSVSIDAEARKKEETLYAIVNKFPSFPFIDISAIKGKWITMTPEDGSWYSEETFTDIKQKEYTEDAKAYLAAALEKKLWTAEGNLPSQTISGVKTQHYRIIVHPEKVGDVYRAVIEKKKAQGKDTKDIEDALKEMEKPDTAAQMKRIFENSSFEVWIDRTKGVLRQFSWRLRAVPPENNEKWKGKQMTTTFTVTLEKVNEQIAVETPSPTIDSDEAERLLTGITKEEQQLKSQLEHVSDIRHALSEINLYGLAFPDSLTDIPSPLGQALERCRNSVPNMNASGNVPIPTLKPSCAALEIATKKKLMLSDEYTKKLFVYANLGNDYTLEYQIPYYEGISEDAKTDFAEGKNTANSEYLSVEKQSKYARYSYSNISPSLESSGIMNTNTNGVMTNDNTNRVLNVNGTTNLNANANTDTNETTPEQDADADGLFETAESIYGTDPKNPDTDGDSYLDGEEVSNGYNPNGAGRLLDSGY